MVHFGDRLRALRTGKGLSQMDFAKQIRISKSSVNMYERGEREPGFETLEVIADYFNVDMDYLLGKSDIVRKSPVLPIVKSSLSEIEQELIRKFRQLDERGKAAVMNSLEHEYAALPQDDDHNILRIAARDGSYQEVTLTDEQAAELQTFLDQLPDVPSGL